MNASCPLVPATGVTAGGFVKIMGIAPAPRVRLMAVLLSGAPKNETFHACHPAPNADGGSQMPASQNQLEYSGRPCEFLGPSKIRLRASTWPAVIHVPPWGVFP